MHAFRFEIILGRFHNELREFSLSVTAHSSPQVYSPTARDDFGALACSRVAGVIAGLLLVK
jgi:hypothetical protein